MKTENVQRQNLIELKKEKCLEIKRSQAEPTIEKSAKKESQTARKSTNPTKLIRNQEIKIGSPLSNKDEEQGTSTYFEVFENSSLSMSVSTENENQCEEQKIVSEDSSVLEKDDNGGAIKDNVENEDKDIEKVWENIRKDLTLSEEENNEIKENDNEFIDTPPEEKIEGPEEEEPSDWEEQEPSDGEIENEKQETNNEKVGECVLILSDEEIEETRPLLKMKELDRQSLEEKNEISVDNSKEVKNEPETVVLSEEKSNEHEDNNLNTIEHPVEEIEKEGTKKVEGNEKKMQLEFQESKDQEFIESDLDTDNEISHMKDVTDTVEYLSEKSTKMSNSDSDNNNMDSTKITIKRSLSSGNEEYELKKIKLDNDADEQLNSNKNNLYPVENGTSDCEMESSPNMTHSKSTILTQKALEDMIAQEICEYMMEGNKNCIMTWKRKNQELESVIETWKKKAENLQQQLFELQVEQKKLQSLGNRAPGIPFKKATRTVGINVRLPQEHLTRTVGTNVNLPQRPIERLPKSLSPSKPISKQILTRSDSTSSQGSAAEKMGASPVPMQLIANTALGSSKGISSTTSSTTIKPVPSSISIIDLTREDGDSAVSSSNSISTATSLASLSGGSVVVSSTPKAITLSSPANQNNQNVVAVPLVCATLPSMMPFLPSAPTGSSANIRPSQPSAAVVPSNLNQGARVTYLVPQVTAAPLSVNPARPGTTNQNIAANPKQPVQTIFLRMSSPSTPTNRFPVQQTVSSSVTPAISVVPVPRSSVANSAISQRPLQTVVVSSVPMNTNTLNSGNTASTEVNQLMPTNKSNQVISKQSSLTNSSSPSTVMISCVAKHPAPLPSHSPNPENPHFKALPPKPALKISRVSSGIVLSWNMILNTTHAEVSSYQLYAYQEGNGPPNTSLWKKVGDVKALPLPMACTLTQFVEGHTYHFAVRAVDAHSRLGPFSDPTSIVLVGRNSITNK